VALSRNMTPRRASCARLENARPGYIVLDVDMPTLVAYGFLGVADNAIVAFTSDNGAETFSWPDGGNGLTDPT
jgi:hypothetical protein